MTEKEAMEYPLHKVWEWFEPRSKLHADAVFQMTRKGISEAWYRHQEVIERNVWSGIEPVRRVLLERCARVEGKHGSYTEFGIVAGEIWSTYRNCDGERTTVGRADSGILARNMAAAYSFWAWELEQREKDGSKVQA